MTRVALVVIALCALAACSGTSRAPIPLHGNFCGPMHPLITATSVDDELRQLAAIPPLDAVDVFCKEHDMCYAKSGYFAERCDGVLLSEMKVIRGHLVRQDCRQLADTVSYAIEAATVGANRPEVAQALGGMRMTSLQDGFNSLLQVPSSIMVETAALAQLGVSTAGQAVKYAVSSGTYGMLPQDMRPDVAEAVALKSQPCNTDVPVALLVPTVRPLLAGPMTTSPDLRNWPGR